MKKILLTALLAAGVVTSANAVTYAYDVASNYSGSATTGGAYALSSKANFAIGNTSISSNYKRKGKFYLNAGHGGFESNDRPTPMPLIGEYFYESEGNLDRTKHLQQWIIKNGGQVKMQRTTNTERDDWDLTAIATGSNNYGGYFISLHSNGANASANYHVALYKGSNSSNSVGGSERMAYWNSYNSYKNGCLTNYTYSTPRSMADYDLMGWHYGVLRTNTCPGYLVETWFHDYRPESLRFKSSLYNKFLAWQIAVGQLTAPGGSGSLPGCVVGDVRDVTKSCGYTNYTARGRDAKLALNDVTVTLSGNGINQTVNTGSKCNGVYAFFVPAGTYTITVKKTGYKTQTHTLTVSNSKATQKNIDMVAGTDAGISVDAPNIGYGETPVGNTSAKTLKVTGSSLSSAITVTNSDNTNFSVTPSSLGTTGGTVNITYKPQAKGSHSTTITLKSGSYTATCKVTGTAVNPVPTFTEVWNYSETSNKKAAWMANWTNYRNMAFGNGKLYVVDAANQVIKIINAQTGAHIKDMNMTGIKGGDGALALVDVAYVGGKIVGTNIAIKADDAATAKKENVLKVYVWDNDDAAPRCILNTTNLGGMDRVGDAIEIQGNLTTGKICYLGQKAREITLGTTTETKNCNSIITYAITNGTVSTTPVVADIDNFIVGLSPRLIPDGSNFWAVGQNYKPTLLNASGEVQLNLNADALKSVQGNDFVKFTFKGDQYAFATEYDPGTSGDTQSMLKNGRAAFLATSGDMSDATRKAYYPSTGLSANTRNGTLSSSICVSVNGDKGIEMWVLVHNQGIAYYKHGTAATFNPGETPSEPVTPPTPSEPSVSYSKGLTKIWQNTTKVPGSAAYNGTGPRYAAVSNGNLIVADNAGKSGSGKILKVDENGYSDYYDPTSAISSNYSLTLGSAIANDDAGNILVNTGFSGASSGSAFMIISADLSKTYKLDLAAAGIGGYATGIRTDQIGRIRGNMLSSEGAYFAFVPNSVTYAVVVKVVNGAVDASKSGVITTGFTSSTVTDIAQPAYEKVSEMSNNASSFYLRSRGVPASVYYEGAKKYTFSNKTTEGYTTTNASVEGFDWFKLGGKSYFIMPMTTDGTTANRGSMFGIFDQDGNIAAYWSTGQKSGLGAASGTFVAVPNDAYSVHIYHFVPGTVAEKLLFAPEDVTISTGVEEIATDVEAPVEYYNLQGVKVANPAKGLYIKKQGKKTTKVIL